RAVVPRPLSPQVRRGIARRLAPTAWRSRAALAGGLAAAGLLAATVFRHGTRPVVPPKGPEVTAAVVAARTPPTVQSYGWALGRSPAALEALLDAQALHSATVGAATRPVHAFAVSDPDFLTWRGHR